MSFITVTVDWSVGIWNSHTPAVVTFGYIMPFVVNGFEFTLRTIKEYREDLNNRAKAIASEKAYKDWQESKAQLTDPKGVLAPIVKFYEPTLTVGHILARLIGILTPFISFIVMIANMDRVFDWIGNAFTYLGKLFSIPLVPKR